MATISFHPSPMAYGPEPIEMTCPYCQKPVTTNIQHKIGSMTIILAFLLVGLFALCCNFTKDVEHVCPNCGRLLGSYKRDCSRRVACYIGLIIAVKVIIIIIIIIIAAVASANESKNG